MYARVASFEGGDEARLQALNRERTADGTMSLPAGLRRAMVLADADARKRLFITFFDSREGIAAVEARFESMGDEIPDEIRGRRISVDVYEVVWDHEG